MGKFDWKPIKYTRVSPDVRWRNKPMKWGIAIKPSIIPRFCYKYEINMWKFESMGEIVERSLPQKQEKRDLVERRRGKHESAEKVTPFTSTRWWSKSIPTRVFPAKPWASWTRSWTICLSVLPANPPALPTTTNGQPSVPAKSRPQYVFFYQGSWPSMLWVKAPRPWRNTTTASEGRAVTQNGSSKNQHIWIPVINNDWLHDVFSCSGRFVTVIFFRWCAAHL